MMMIQLNFPHVIVQNLDHLLDVFLSLNYGILVFNFILLFRKESLEAIILSFILTFIPIFDIPVFWPILVVYFMVPHSNLFLIVRCSSWWRCVIVLPIWFIIVIFLGHMEKRSTIRNRVLVDGLWQCLLII